MRYFWEGRALKKKQQNQRFAGILRALRVEMGVLCKMSLAVD